MRTGVIYARYSAGPNQTDQSIEGQVADCTAYARDNEIEIIGTYADRHISGKSVEGRDEFQRMIRDAEAHKFDCVIVWKIDRFGRNRQDIAINKMRLKHAGVQLLYAKEAVPDGPEGILLESLLEGLAEYYSEDLKQKVRRGMQTAAKQGKYSGRSVPIGYKLDENRHVIVDEDAAPYVRKMFEMHIAGRTYTEISEMFSRAGICGLDSGKPLSSATLYRMLKNPRYTGEWELAGIPLDVPGIVDEDVFIEAQKHFKTSRNNAEHKAKVNYLLSGKVICGYCGSRVLCDCATSKTGDKHHYYTCGGRKRGSKCELKPVRQQVLEDAVIEATVKDMLTEEAIGHLVKRMMEVQDERAASSYLKTLQDRLADQRRRRENVLKALETAPDLKSITDRLRAIENDIKETMSEIKKEELGNPRIEEPVIRCWLESFRRGEKDDPTFRRRIVETFIHHVELKNGEAIIYYNTNENGILKSSDTVLQVDLVKSYPNLLIPFHKPLFIADIIILRIDLQAA